MFCDVAQAAKRNYLTVDPVVFFSVKLVGKFEVEPVECGPDAVRTCTAIALL